MAKSSRGRCGAARGLGRCRQGPDMTPIRFAILRWMLAAACALGALRASAQTLDDVSVATQGSDIVVRIAFNASVRLLQQTPQSPADLYRLGVELVAAEDGVLR